MDDNAPQPKQTDDTVSFESDRSIKLHAFQEAASSMQLFTQRSVRYDSGSLENQILTKSILKSTRSSRRQSLQEKTGQEQTADIKTTDPKVVKETKGEDTDLSSNNIDEK